MITKEINKQYLSFLSIFATKDYLSSKSEDYGWFVDENFIIPYYVTKKLFFKYIVFSSETIYINDSLSKDDEKRFLNEVILDIKKNLPYIDFIVQSPTNVVFNTFPDNSIYCEFGSYQIDLKRDEDVLFSNLHSKHRNVIRKAKKDGVIVNRGIEFKDEAFKIVQDTMLRQGMNPPSRDIFNNEVEKINGNLEFYITIKDEKIQGSAIIYWNKNGAYYVHGGSCEKPYGGSLNLMHWKIIKYMKSREVKLYDFVGARIKPKEGSKLEGIQRFKSRFGSTIPTISISPRSSRPRIQCTWVCTKPTTPTRSGFFSGFSCPLMFTASKLTSHFTTRGHSIIRHSRVFSMWDDNQFILLWLL